MTLKVSVALTTSKTQQCNLFGDQEEACPISRCNSCSRSGRSNSSILLVVVVAEVVAIVEEAVPCVALEVAVV